MLSAESACHALSRPNRLGNVFVYAERARRVSTLCGPGMVAASPGVSDVVPFVFWPKASDRLSANGTP